MFPRLGVLDAVQDYAVTISERRTGVPAHLAFNVEVREMEAGAVGSYKTYLGTRVLRPS